MGKLRFLVLAWMGLCSSVFAETWLLRDEQTGEQFGPVTPSNGAVVAVGGRTLTLHVSQTARDKTVDRLKRIMIPAVEFREAKIKDVLQFLMEASIAADSEKEGVNVVFKERRLEEGVEFRSPSPEERLEGQLASDGQWGDFGEFSPPLQSEGAGILTLNLRRVSLYDVIETITELAGLKWRISEGGIVMMEEK